MSRKKSQASLSDELKQCLTVLKAVKALVDAAPFNEPVDWKGLGLPDYPKIIKNPMDLGTVETKLNAGKYANADAFAADVRLVWKNAKTYNQEGSEIHSAAATLSKAFEKRYAKVKKSSSSSSSSGNKRKRPDKGGDTREVTRQDRLKFSQLVNQMTSDQLGRMVGIIQRTCPEALNEEDDDELEIEINAIHPHTLLELNAYAQDCVAGNGSKKKRFR